MLIFLILAVQCDKSRIYGGNIVEKQSSFTYIVSLRITDEDKHFCGGSIVDKYWILTSARCIFG